MEKYQYLFRSRAGARILEDDVCAFFCVLMLIRLCQKAGLLPDSSGVTPEFSRLDVGRRSNGMLEMDTLLDDKDEGPRNPVADDAPPTCVAEAGPSSVSLVDAPRISKLTDELRRISRINPNWCAKPNC